MEGIYVFEEGEQVNWKGDEFHEDIQQVGGLGKRGQVRESRGMGCSKEGAG